MLALACRNAIKTLTVADEAMIEADGVVAGQDLQASSLSPHLSAGKLSASNCWSVGRSVYLPV